MIHHVFQLSALQEPMVIPCVAGDLGRRQTEDVAMDPEEAGDRTGRPWAPWMGWVWLDGWVAGSLVGWWVGCRCWMVFGLVGSFQNFFMAKANNNQEDIPKQDQHTSIRNRDGYLSVPANPKTLTGQHAMAHSLVL